MRNTSAAEPNAYSAFISHDSSDRTFAEALCAQLERAGFRCWMAPRDVRPGQDYPAEIISGIENAKCMVLVLSAQSNQSAFVKAEVERAYSKGKPIFPVRVADVLPSKGLELFVSTQHWIDAWKGTLTEHVEKLALEIARGPTIESISPAFQHRLIRQRWVGTGVIAFVVAVVSLGVALIVKEEGSSSDTPYYSEPTVDLDVSLRSYGNAIRFYISDGHIFTNDGDSPPYNLLKNDPVFAIYAFDNSVIDKRYQSPAGMFEKYFDFSEAINAPVGVWPPYILYCLSYLIEPEQRWQMKIEGFVVEPDSESDISGSDVKIINTAPSEIVDVDEGASCDPVVQDYAKRHLTDNL